MKSAKTGREGGDVWAILSFLLLSSFVMVAQTDSSVRWQTVMHCKEYYLFSPLPLSAISWGRVNCHLNSGYCSGQNGFTFFFL